ncbi:MAG: hypothetical protein WC967_08950 [Balneolaceae bacterium]
MKSIIKQIFVCVVSVIIINTVAFEITLAQNKYENKSQIKGHVKELFTENSRKQLNSAEEVLRLNVIEKAQKSEKISIVTLPLDLYKEMVLSFNFDISQREINLQKTNNAKKFW